MAPTDPEDIERAIDELYAGPLEEFTAARNRLAAGLRERGDGAGAARVKALKKPNLPAWAINRLARSHRADLSSLFTTGEQLRASTGTVLRGRGDPDEVRGISAKEREQVTALVAEALSMLEQEGHAVTATHRERIADTLYATASDPETRALVEGGRLVADERRVGFGDGAPDLAVVAGTPEAREEAPDPAERERARRRERLSVKLRAHEEDAARLADEAEEAERRARDAAGALERLEVEAARARGRAERAAERLEGTKRDLAGI